jgi:uncharacterized membrane protein (DUF2068 family)
MRKVKKKLLSFLGLRTVAIFEGAKGALVLLTGFGLFTLIHKDIHYAAERLVRHLHMNPASHYPSIFLDAAANITDMQLLFMAFAALMYSIVRFAEAIIGLWCQQPWAEWFGMLTGGMYLPIEIVGVMRRITWPKVTVLTVNTFVVAYLAYVLLKSKGRHKHAKR